MKQHHVGGSPYYGLQEMSLGGSSIFQIGFSRLKGGEEIIEKQAEYVAGSPSYDFRDLLEFMVFDLDDMK